MAGEWLVLVAGMCFGAALATAFCLIVLTSPLPSARRRGGPGRRIRRGGFEISGIHSSHWVHIEGVPPAASDFERSKEG